MALRIAERIESTLDAGEPDDTVHPISLDWRLALHFHTKFDKERSSSLKVVDNDTDVVHPLNRHRFRSIGDRARSGPTPAGPQQRPTPQLEHVRRRLASVTARPVVPCV